MRWPLMWLTVNCLKDAGTRQLKFAKLELARGETVELQTVEDEDLGVDIDSDLAEFIQVSRPDANFDELTISGDLIERVRQILKNIARSAAARLWVHPGPPVAHGRSSRNR